jgi:hypothetical protein
VAAAVVADAVDAGGRGGAAAGVGAGVLVAVGVVLAGQWALGAPELREVVRELRAPK